MRAFAFSTVLASIDIFTCACLGSSPDSGVEGIITISPTRPGPLRRDDPVSKPLSDIVFAVQDGEKRVATFTTDGEGRFRLLLKPGHYTVLREGPKSAAGFFGPFEIDVVAGKMTKAEWQCDSGMR
jgi:hypothetical protein